MPDTRRHGWQLVGFANNALTITGSGNTGSVIATLTKGGYELSILDLRQPPGTQHGKALRVFEPGDETSTTPVTYIGNGGEILTRAFITATGVTSGSGDSYQLVPPVGASYPMMLGAWADVPYSIVSRTYNGAPSGDETGGYLFAGLDWNGYFRLLIPSDGALCWGPGGSTYAQGGNAPAIDTRLGRNSAGTLYLGNGTYGDYSGTLKLTTLAFADGTTQTTALAAGSPFSGATSGSAGTTGLVPAPAAGNQNYILRGDATWQPFSAFGVSLASGKSLTINNTLTLAGADSKTLTVNNSLGFSGTDGTTMTLPWASDTLAGLNTVQTWTAQQKFDFNIRFANNVGLEGTLVNGSAVNLFSLDSGNNMNFGAAALTGNLVFYPEQANRSALLTPQPLDTSSPCRKARARRASVPMLSIPS